MRSGIVPFHLRLKIPPAACLTKVSTFGLVAAEMPSRRNAFGLKPMTAPQPGNR
jgi:hypothetical protein